MKRLIFTVLVAMLVLSEATAQSKRISKAESAYQKGEYAKALKKITKATQHRKTKDTPRTWLMQGTIYQTLALQASSDSLHETYLQHAIAAYRHMQTLGNHDSVLTTQPMDSLWQSYYTQARQHADQQQYEEALTALHRARMVKPKDSTTYLAQGEIALRKQDYQLAQQTYDYLLDSLHYDGVQLYEVYNTLVDVSSLQETEAAKTQTLLKQAQALFPDSTYWIDREFALLTNHERWKEAEQLINNSSLSTAAQIELIRELAHQQRIRNHFEEAQYYYQLALKMDEQNLEVLYDLAYLHQEKAIASEKAIGEDQTAIKERREQALIHYRKSLEYLTLAISLDQNNDHTLQNITLVKKHIGSLERL